MKPPTTRLSATNTVLTGVYFGALQWSAFFLLQSYLASTAIVYLLATAAWMVGSLAGLALPGKSRELAWLAASIACFGLLHLLATTHPFEMNWLPALLLCLAGMGGYAGRFFRFRAMAGITTDSDRLFLWENTGFLGGMGLTLVLLCGIGDSTLLLVPAVGAVLCGATQLGMPAVSEETFTPGTAVPGRPRIHVSRSAKPESAPGGRL
jgi:hypothetical protein